MEAFEQDVRADEVWHGRRMALHNLVPVHGASGALSAP